MLDFNPDPPAPTEVSAVKHALAHAERGWPVFPCNPLTKAPLTDHGFKQATTNVMQIKAWWAKWPQAMIGVPTGKLSGFWVLDIDTDEAKGKDGLGSLAGIGHGLQDLTDTVVSRTGSGGYHCLYKWTEGGPTNARGSLPRHIDVRGEGGYIVAAGSQLADGREYAWLNPPDENDIAEAPEWLTGMIGQGGSTHPLNFNSAAKVVSPAARVQAIEPGRWHENTRDLVARMVREGATDDTIAAISLRFVEPGYTHQQTMQEFLTHARTARAKWGYQPRAIEPEQTDPNAPFKFNVTFFEDIPDEHHKNWLVRDIFGENELTIVYGAPGCGKSVLIGDAAAHVAAGLDWFGRAVKPCAVLYIAAERHALVKRRMAAFRKRHGIDGLPLVVLDGLFNFATDPSHADEIVRIAAHVAERTGLSVGWIIVDTKAQVMGGGDENASKDISVLNNNLARMQACGAHVTIIDHTPQTDPKRMKGNGGLAGAADGSFLVQKEGGVRSLSIGSKAPNDGPDDITIVFKLEGVVLGTNQDGEETTAPVVVQADAEAVEKLENNRTKSEPAQRLGPLESKILTALGQAATAGQGLRFMRLKMMVGSDHTDSGIDKALKKLRSNGQIKQEEMEWKLT